MMMTMRRRRRRRRRGRRRKRRGRFVRGMRERNRHNVMCRWENWLQRRRRRRRRMCGPRSRPDLSNLRREKQVEVTEHAARNRQKVKVSLSCM